MKRLFYTKTFILINKNILSLFYDPQYLEGKYFYEKRMGWLWAWKGIRNKLLGGNKKIPWPVGKNIIISNSKNIKFHNSSINIFQMQGCYYQCHKGVISIGKNVHIAPNCGIITTNHDVYNPEEHAEGKDITIGDNCWIGMNSVILPGVTLGKNTIVGAGSIVTKSFEEGYMVIGGNPAKPIYRLDKSGCENKEAR